MPKTVRDAHGWKAGTEFELVEDERGVLLQPVEQVDPRFPPITLEEFFAIDTIKMTGPSRLG